MARYSEYNQEQQYFITLDKEINFPEGTYVRFLNDIIEEYFDIKPFENKRKNEIVGAPAKHAKMMLKIIFYGFSIGIFSLRKIAKEYVPNHLDFIFLTGYNTVHYSTLSRFINLYKEEIMKLFTTVFYITHNMGYITKEFTAIDGCKIKANASKKFTGNYISFSKRKKTYEKMIENLLKRANRLNEREERGEIEKDKADKDRKNIKRLEKTYKHSLDKINRFLEECEGGGRKEDKKQVNLIDRESGLMEKDNKYFQGYNCQVSVNEHGLIVSNDVSGSASDRVLMERMVKQTGVVLKEMKMREEVKSISYLMDKGYHDSLAMGKLTREQYNIFIPFHERANLKESKKVESHHCGLEKEGDVCVLTCPGEQEMRKEKAVKDRDNYFYKFYADKKICKSCRYGYKCIAFVKRKKCFQVKKEVFDNLNELKIIKSRMANEYNKDIYNKRFGYVEPVFGTITSKRGFDSFLVNGKEKVKSIWSLVCSAFNLRRLFVLEYST